MAQRYLHMALFSCFILGALFDTAAAAEGESDRPDSADTPTHLFQRKAEEARIVHELNKANPPVGDALLPVYDAPAFTLAQDGTVMWLAERYTRYVQVSSATELTNALSAAKPGDFIHLQDGLYQGNFVIERSGMANRRIALYGTRRAVLEGQSIKQGYGLHLAADYWNLFGFTIRKASKGLMLDRASHNRINGLEIYQTGDEGLHLRSFSSDNLVTKVWVHDVGRVNPQFGEGIYVGSAVSNWPVYTDSKPDRSDHNRLIGNLLGPSLTAEAIDLKEGTTGGIVRNNSFVTDQQLLVDSWIDVKGNRYEISHNRGSYAAGSNFRTPIDIQHPVAGWGQNNVITPHQTYVTDQATPTPFFVSETITEESNERFSRGVYLILRARPMPYTLSELAAYFPDSFQSVGADTLFVRANIFVGQGATLQITADDAARVRLLSSPERYVNITGFLGHIVIKGSPAQRLDFEAWDPTQARPDSERSDGRAYLLALGGRMDIADAGFFDLGYEEGIVSGVAWKSVKRAGEIIWGRGNVRNSHFVRNYFGAYTFEAVGMHWIGNTFAHNISYGFDPHDFSNYFLVENNSAHNNGSHGIIFSRGCDYNVIRGNKSFANQGHGIMLDDGKVIPDSENVRYHVAVPSNYNVIEDNFVVNNLDGIVLEGGKNSVVRHNMVIGPHRYGLRLTDKVQTTLVVSNTIENSERFGIYVYDQSTHNQFRQNTITYGAGGIALQDAPQNTFTGNVVSNIKGSAMTLKGNLAATLITHNSFSGAGANPLYTEQMTGVDVTAVRNINDFSRWRFPPPAAVPYFVLSIWSVIFGVPLFMTLKRIVVSFLFAI